MTHLEEYENKFDLTKLYTVPYEYLYEIQEAAKNTMRSTRRQAHRCYLSEAWHTYHYAMKIVEEIDKEYEVRKAMNLVPIVPYVSKAPHRKVYTKRVRYVSF